jgi:hypothetical protein
MVSGLLEAEEGPIRARAPLTGADAARPARTSPTLQVPHLSKHGLAAVRGATLLLLSASSRYARAMCAGHVGRRRHQDGAVGSHGGSLEGHAGIATRGRERRPAAHAVPDAVAQPAPPRRSRVRPRARLRALRYAWLVHRAQQVQHAQRALSEARRESALDVAAVRAALDDARTNLKRCAQVKSKATSFGASRTRSRKRRTA